MYQHQAFSLPLPTSFQSHHHNSHTFHPTYQYYISAQFGGIRAPYNNFSDPNSQYIFQHPNNHSQGGIEYNFNNYMPPSPFTNGSVQSVQKYDIFNPPPLNHPVPEVHHTYLSELTDTVKFDNPDIAPPHALINYLLKFLSKEDCGYPLSALVLISVKIPHFCWHFAQYELEYFIKILRQKFPINLDYCLEYKKLLIMDQKQAYKLLDLIQTLCILSSALEQHYLERHNEFSPITQQYYYIKWIINYVMVLLQHYQHLLQSQENSGLSILQLAQTINKNVYQLKNLLQQSQHFLEDAANRNKIIHVVYQMLPHSSIISPHQLAGTESSGCTLHKILYQLVEYYILTCDKYSINGTKQIYTCIQGHLLQKISRIGAETQSIKQQLRLNNKIQRMFQYFSFKLLNALSLKIWTKQQKLLFIQLLQGCRFICGLNGFTNEEDPYKEVTELAFSIAKQKNTRMKLAEKKAQGWLKAKPNRDQPEKMGEIDCNQFW